MCGRVLAGEGDEGWVDHREESGGLTSPWAINESVVFVDLVSGSCEHDMI